MKPPDDFDPFSAATWTRTGYAQGLEDAAKECAARATRLEARPKEQGLQRGEGNRNRAKWAAQARELRRTVGRLREMAAATAPTPSEQKNIAGGVAL